MAMAGERTRARGINKRSSGGGTAEKARERNTIMQGAVERRADGAHLDKAGVRVATR